MKEELDKIARALASFIDADGYAVDEGGYETIEMGSHAQEINDGRLVFDHIRPRLEKALKLLEQHELLNSMDSGDQ